MSILEGIGHCIPVVSTPVGGIPQIVIDGYNGFLCEPGNAREIADAVIKLLTDYATYEQFVQNARKIAEKHSLEVYERDLSIIYDEVVK